MNVGCIIQARLDSARLPRKVLADIGGWAMIRHVYERAFWVGIPTVIACPNGDEMEIWRATNQQALVLGVPDCSPEDVLQRFLIVAKLQGYDAIMRVTGDCPLLDPDACSRVLKRFNAGEYDYVANDLRPSYPKGMGCEVFTREALERAHQNARLANPRDREHVTPWVVRGVRGDYFDGRNLRCPIVGVENLNFSVDTLEDLERVRAIDARLPEGHLKYALETTLEAWRRVQESNEDLRTLDADISTSDKSQ